jgi:hypothetical protein
MQTGSLSCAFYAIDAALYATTVNRVRILCQVETINTLLNRRVSTSSWLPVDST